MTNKGYAQRFLTVTALGRHFEIPGTKINQLLSELGWIAKDIKGWQVTELGKRLGGTTQGYLWSPLCPMA